MSAPSRWPERIHFHTDCYTFSGSETTLMLLAEAAFASGGKASFTYRRWPDYEAGLARHLPAGVSAEGLRLPDPLDVKQALTGGRRHGWARVMRGAIALIPLRQLCLLYDIVRLVVRLRQSRPDVLHVNNGGLPGAISANGAAIAGHVARVPVVVMVVNNLAVPYRRPGRWFDYPVDRLVARSVTRFVTGSAAAGQALRDVLQLPVEQHTVIPNGVEYAQPRASRQTTRAQVGASTDDTVIVVVARLEARKGHRDLFAALDTLPRSVLDRLVVAVAGDGPERDNLEKVVAERGLTSQVRFLGAHDDPWALYDLADLVVLPSIGHEDLPVVLIEAMAAGRPVVATRVAGAVELVDDEVTGLLVAPHQPDRLATAIAMLLDDGDRRRAMGEAARRRYESTYTPALVVARYLELYRDLLDEVGR